MGPREAKERLKVHNLRINHVTIQLELRYSTVNKAGKLKWQVFSGKTGPIAPVLDIRGVYQF
jgi:hypothetical protein